jgi:hypothetical protein
MREKHSHRHKQDTLKARTYEQNGTRTI